MAMAKTSPPNTWPHSLKVLQDRPAVQAPCRPGCDDVRRGPAFPMAQQRVHVPVWHVNGFGDPPSWTAPARSWRATRAASRCAGSCDRRGRRRLFREPLIGSLVRALRAVRGPLCEQGRPGGALWEAHVRRARSLSGIAN